MKKSRFSDNQIVSILKQAEGGIPIPELCREHGMSSASFYKWRAKYGGMDASLMRRLKELESENSRLKKMYAEIADWLIRLTQCEGIWLEPQGFGVTTTSVPIWGLGGITPNQKLKWQHETALIFSSLPFL